MIKILTFNFIPELNIHKYVTLTQQRNKINGETPPAEI